MTTATTDTIDVEHLYVSSLDVKPINFSWDYETNIEYGENGVWRHFDRRSPEDGDDTWCEHCGDAIEYRDGGWVHTWDPSELAEDDDKDEPLRDPDYCLLDPEQRAEPASDWRMEGVDGPMMNYYYPIDLRPEEIEAAADKLADAWLPLCLVEVNDEYGLALTGGGMDLSWEICSAYINLGHLPPFHFASDLPKMAQTLGDRQRTVLAAARRTCEIMVQWAQRGAQRIDEVERWYTNEEWKRY